MANTAAPASGYTLRRRCCYRWAAADFRNCFPRVKNDEIEKKVAPEMFVEFFCHSS